MAWTAAQDQMLRDFYEQYPADQKIPLADIAAVLGKETRSIRTRAHALGISVGTRPRYTPPRKHFPTPCAICGETFIPAKLRDTTTQTCGRSCGRKLAIQENGHPKGATGMKHTTEAKATIAANSRAMWAAMPADEREKRAETMRGLAAGRRPTERTHTRSKGGRRADVGNQYFRSRWEANYARWLNFHIANTADDVASWTYEPRTFSFPVKRGTMSYTPDFLVTFRDGHTEWHEVKGWLTQQGATALKRFAKYYPDETLVLIDEPAYKAIAKVASPLIEGWE